MLASRYGKDGCLQLLIAARVDLEAKDNVSEKMQVGLLVNASERVNERVSMRRDVCLFVCVLGGGSLSRCSITW